MKKGRHPSHRGRPNTKGTEMDSNAAAPPDNPTHRLRRKSIFAVRRCPRPRRWTDVEGEPLGRCTLCGGYSTAWVAGEKVIEFCRACAESALVDLIEVATGESSIAGTKKRTKGSYFDEADAIDSRRVTMKPDPVRHYHVPRWLRKHIKNAAEEGKIMTPSMPETSCDFLMDVAHEIARRIHPDWTFGNRWIDHWGSAQKGTVFVSEPYAITSHITTAMKFADVLDLDFHLSSNSWWNPGQTLRFEFREHGHPDTYSRYVRGPKKKFPTPKAVSKRIELQHHTSN